MTAADKGKDKEKEKDKVGASGDLIVIASGKGSEKKPTALSRGGSSSSLSPRSELIARALSLAVGDKVRHTHAHRNTSCQQYSRQIQF